MYKVRAFFCGKITKNLRETCKSSDIFSKIYTENNYTITRSSTLYFGFKKRSVISAGLIDLNVEIRFTAARRIQKSDGYIFTDQ